MMLRANQRTCFFLSILQLSNQLLRNCFATAAPLYRVPGQRSSGRDQSHWICSGRRLQPHLRAENQFRRHRTRHADQRDPIQVAGDSSSRAHRTYSSDCCGSQSSASTSTACTAYWPNGCNSNWIRWRCEPSDDCVPSPGRDLSQLKSSYRLITFVFQNGGHHQQSFTSDDQQQPTAPAPTAQYPSGITYAQPNPQYNPSTAPEYHYSLSAPAGHYPQQAVQYIQQPIQQGHPQVLTHQPVVYYSHHAHYPQEPVQYVTFQPQHQQPYHHHHIASNLVAPQVHEEGRTYSAPSRHTLETNTQQQKFFKSQPQIPVGFRPKPALINPQPQYVYVQAGNVASANQQRQYQQKYQQQQQQQQQVPTPAPHKVQNVEIVASQGHQIAPVEYVPQQSTVQSTPYYQYSGSFGHPQAQ